MKIIHGSVHLSTFGFPFPGEALRCHCGGRRQCLESVETCKGADDVCASIIFTGPGKYIYFCTVHVQKKPIHFRVRVITITQNLTKVSNDPFCLLSVVTVPGYFQSCYPSFECQLLSSSSITQGFCCSKDLCN